VGCRDNADCTPAERCLAGTCALFGDCGEDDDCPGSRSCGDDGRCQPAPCAGDRFEAAEEPPELATRTYTGLVLCDGTLDRFRAPLAAGAGLRVVLRHPPGAGDLSLSLRDPGGPLGRSDRRLGLELLEVAPGAADRDLEVTVEGRPGSSVEYALTLEALPADACADDPREGPLGNDDREHAAPVGQGTTRLVLCPGDEDWLALPLAAGSRLTVEVTGVDPAAVALTLLDAAGQPWDEGEDDGNGMLVAGGDAPQGGMVFARVRAADPADRLEVDVAVRVEALPEAEAMACVAPELLQPGDWQPLPPTLPVSRFELSCADEWGADHLVRFVLPERALVSVEAAGLPGQEATLALRQTCDAPASELACEAAALPPMDLAPGTWFVLARTDGAAPPELRLEVVASCAVDGECPAGRVCSAGFCQPVCAGEEDCSGAQTCAPTGHCVEPGVCTADEDCLGTRICGHEVCFEPDCELHADCAGDCVDRQCLPETPRTCDADTPCPGPQTCAPLGACVLDQPCADDDDCPAGTPRCVADRCVECTDDAGCPGAHACVHGACSYHGSCVQHADCPGDRLCDELGMCRPAVCLGDVFDEEPGSALLAPRAYTGLVLCDGDQDLYRLETAPGQGLLAVLRHDPAQGDLSLAGMSDEAGVRTSDGRSGVEVVGFSDQPGLQEVDLAVRGRPGATVVYSLDLRPRPGPFCPPDPLEGLLGNDDAAHASPIWPGTLDAALCPGDEDWFSLELAAGTRLRALSTGDAAPAGLALHGPDDGLLSTAPGGGPRELEADLAASGRHTLRVSGAPGAGSLPYSLEVEANAADDALRLACAAAPEIVVGQELPLPDVVHVNRFSLSCGQDKDTADDLVRCGLNDPAEVDVELLGPTPDAALAVRADCEQPAEVACETGTEPAARGLQLPVGTWFVLVERSPGLHRLRVSAAP